LLFELRTVKLLSTTPGLGGGERVLDAAKYRYPKHGANILETFSLPEFHKNFCPTEGICFLGQDRQNRNSSSFNSRNC